MDGWERKRRSRGDRVYENETDRAYQEAISSGYGEVQTPDSNQNMADMSKLAASRGAGGGVGDTMTQAGLIGLASKGALGPYAPALLAGGAVFGALSDKQAKDAQAQEVARQERREDRDILSNKLAATATMMGRMRL